MLITKYCCERLHWEGKLRIEMRFNLTLRECFSPGSLLNISIKAHPAPPPPPPVMQHVTQILVKWLLAGFLFWGILIYYRSIRLILQRYILWKILFH